MAELADAYDSGSYFRKEVQVQFLLPAPPLKAFVYAALGVFLCLKFYLKLLVTSKKRAHNIKLCACRVCYIYSTEEY